MKLPRNLNNKMMDFSSFKPNDNHKNLKASKKPDIRIKFQTKKDRVKP